MRLQSFFRVAFVLVLPLLAASARADTIGIGTAAPFAVLGEAGVTNTGAGTTLYGSVAGSTGTPAVTGLVATNVIAPGALILTGVANSGVGTPFGDATAAYTTAQGTGGAVLEGINTLGAGGLTSLGPGVYNFSSATSLNGLLQLNAGGSNSASWIFQIGSSLTTASGSTVEVVNAGGPGAFTGSITWVTGAGDMIGTTTTFLGTIIADTGTVAIGNSATIQCGRAIALSGAVTLNTNTIAIPDCTVASTEGSPGTGFTVSGEVLPPVGGSGGSVSTPEPGTFVLLLAGLGGLLAFRKVWGVSSGADCA
jgi:hypothetical protein